MGYSNYRSAMGDVMSRRRRLVAILQAALASYIYHNLWSKHLKTIHNINLSYMYFEQWEIPKWLAKCPKGESPLTFFNTLGENTSQEVESLMV